jgi:hypothetical protein
MVDAFAIPLQDQVDEDYYTIASEQGLRSLLAACPGMQKTCELYCTGAGFSPFSPTITQRRVHDAETHFVIL